MSIFRIIISMLIDRAGFISGFTKHLNAAFLHVFAFNRAYGIPAVRLFACKRLFVGCVLAVLPVFLCSGIEEQKILLY